MPENRRQRLSPIWSEKPRSPSTTRSARGFTRRIDATVSVLDAVGIVLLAIPNAPLALVLSVLAFGLWMVATFVTLPEGYRPSFTVCRSMSRDRTPKYRVI